MKMFMKTLPSNYTPVKPTGSCGMLAKEKFNCVQRQFKRQPSGLGMNMMNEMMDALFSQAHNESAKGMEIERVGKESEMNNILKKIKPIIKGL